MKELGLDLAKVQSNFSEALADPDALGHHRGRQGGRVDRTAGRHQPDGATSPMAG